MTVKGYRREVVELAGGRTGSCTYAGEAARIILDHIASRARANKYKEVRTRFAGCNDALLAEADAKFGVVSPFGGPTSSGMLTLHCPPAQLYGAGIGSNYQAQGLKLSKHFR